MDIGVLLAEEEKSLTYSLIRNQSPLIFWGILTVAHVAYAFCRECRFVSSVSRNLERVWR